ncbi:MAG: PepSY domain-containing protein [Sarcina sp.]
MKKIAITAIIGLLIGTGIGFGGISVLATPSHVSPVTTNTALSIPNGIIPIIEAKSIALNKEPGSTIVSTDFIDGAVPTYKIITANGTNEYTISINGKTGDIISSIKTTTKTPLTFKANINGVISETQAREIASKAVPNSTLTGLTLDYQNLATPEYDIIQQTAQNKYYVCINAKTGDIISNTQIAL